MTPELLRALVTIAFGALAGGITNTLAVWMLFHPYRPPAIGPLRFTFLHGAIPKNQDRLAAAVGGVVGDRLLTTQDLTGILSNREFREAFDARLEAFLREVLERERGTVREIFPPELTEQAVAMLEGVADNLASRLEAWLDSAGFEASVEARVRAFTDDLSDEPVARILTAKREEAIVAAAEGWVTQVIERDGFRTAVEDYLDRTIEGFLREDRTFEEVLPAGLVSSLERALSGYLPLAVRKLGGILEDPEARVRVQSAVHELFQRFLRDLRFHQRVVARLLVTEETLQRILVTIEEEGSERLSEMLRDPAVQDAMARKVNDAVLDFLQRPVTAVLGRPEDENVRRARDAVAAWVLGMTRDADTRDFVLEKLRQGLGRAAAGTWGDLMPGTGAEHMSRGIVAAARSAPARRVYREALGRAVVGTLDRPIGRPADWLPSGSTARFEEALSDPLWEWLQAQTPHVVRTLDVARRVEDKVRSYPTARMEELVRRVTHRELRLIVRLGYLLGAVIGGALVAVNAFLT